MLTSAASRWLSGVGTFATISARALASHSAITFAEVEVARQARERPSSRLDRTFNRTLGREALGNADDSIDVMMSSWILMRHGPDRPPSRLSQGVDPECAQRVGARPRSAIQ